jgi:ubiquitin-conjugating enzyme E2 M
MVRALLQVYHPNIDLEGKICLNILREDWKPVLSISSVIYGLQFLFLVSRERVSRTGAAA